MNKIDNIGKSDLIRMIIQKSPYKYYKYLLGHTQGLHEQGLIINPIFYYLYVFKWLAFTGEHAFIDWFKNMFKCLDANDDNFIDLAEWKVHNAAFGIPPGRAEDSFNAIDKDGDEKVTEDEFDTEYFHTMKNKLNSAILFGPL